MDIDSDDNDGGMLRIPDSGSLIRGASVDDGATQQQHLYQNAEEAAAAAQSQAQQQLLLHAQQKKFATVGVPMTTFKPPYRNSRNNGVRVCVHKVLPRLY